MSVIGNKDSNGLETVRYYENADPVYYTVLNTPVEDLEQRTIDLNSIMASARSLRVRATSPASKNVEVETGMYMDGDTNPLYFPQGAAGTTLTVSDAPAGFYRVDLVYFNLDSGTISLSAGAPTNVDWATAWTNRGTLPAVGTTIPLAFLYVPDAAATMYQDGLTGDTAGRIRDARIAIDASARVFEDTAGVLQKDAVLGAVGSSFKVARSDHRHDTNIDATNPSSLYPDSASAIGGSGVYSRSDHEHRIVPETAAINILRDLAGGSLGTTNLIARADHQHDLNISAALPEAIGVVAKAAGSSNIYGRADHRHPVAGLTWSYHVENLVWNGAFGNIDTGPIGFDPLLAIVIGSGYNSLNRSWNSFGVCIGLSVDDQAACGVLGQDGPDYMATTFSWDTGKVAGYHNPDGLNGFIDSMDVAYKISQWSSSNVRFEWISSSGMTYSGNTVVILGQA